jgi:hypothetical protein
MADDLSMPPSTTVVEAEVGEVLLGSEVLVRRCQGQDRGGHEALSWVGRARSWGVFGWNFVAYSESSWRVVDVSKYEMTAFMDVVEMGIYRVL